VGYIGRFASRSWRRLSQSSAAASPQEPAATPTPPHRQLSNAATRAPRRRRARYLDWSDSSRPATNLKARSTVVGGRSTAILAPAAASFHVHSLLHSTREKGIPGAVEGAHGSLGGITEDGGAGRHGAAGWRSEWRRAQDRGRPLHPTLAPVCLHLLPLGFWVLADPDLTISSPRLPSWSDTIITGYLFHVCVFGHIGGAFLYLLISFCRHMNRKKKTGRDKGRSRDRSYVGGYLAGRNKWIGGFLLLFLCALWSVVNRIYKIHWFVYCLHLYFQNSYSVALFHSGWINNVNCIDLLLCWFTF
jgi:hypothetical protein